MFGDRAACSGSPRAGVALSGGIGALAAAAAARRSCSACSSASSSASSARSGWRSGCGLAPMPRGDQLAPALRRGAAVRDRLHDEPVHRRARLPRRSGAGRRGQDRHAGRVAAVGAGRLSSSCAWRRHRSVRPRTTRGLDEVFAADEPDDDAAPKRLELLGQLGDDLEQVADQADVGDLEDRRVLVLVDGDDGLAESFIPARCWIAPEMPIAI